MISFFDSGIPNPNISISAGEWFLSFFKDFIGTPAILIGLFAMLGSILLRKNGTQIIMSFFKTAAGFLIIGGGAGVLVASLQNFQVLFTDLFNVSGLIPNNDAFAGSLFSSFPQIAQLGSIIMVLAMCLNILLARTSRFKYIYLSGHVLFYMSIMISGVMVLGAGLDLEKPGDYSIALISSGLILSIYMVLSAASTRKYVQRITKSDDISIGHTGSIGYVLSGLIGDLIFKIKKDENIKSTEDINFPKGLQFFRNTFASMAVTMLVVFFIVYIPEGIMYNTGIKLIPEGANGEALRAIFETGTINWLVRCILDAFTFAAGVEIILYGVRMAIGELVPAFKGISDKLVKNAKAAIDCPIIFPYAPNAVLIGFLSSMIAGILGIGLTLAVRLANPLILPVIIPGIIAHFFLGATSGVFGNSKGGIWGAVIGSFVHGLIITFVPIIFIAGSWSPSKDLGWGDTDYLIGVIPGIIGFIENKIVMKTMLILIPSFFFIVLVIDGLLNEFTFNSKNKRNKNIEINEEKLKEVNEKKVV